MPQHCYSIPDGSGFQADYHNWDWTVTWNTNVYSIQNVAQATVDDPTTRNSFFCD